MISRQIFPATLATPTAFDDVGGTGAVVWTEVVSSTPAPIPTDPPIIVWGDSYADGIVGDGDTVFLLASRIVDAIIAGRIPAPKVPMAVNVIVALVTTPPAYALNYDGETGLFEVATPPPVDFIENHNWAGWPMYPPPPPPPPPGP